MTKLGRLVLTRGDLAHLPKSTPKGIYQGPPSNETGTPGVLQDRTAAFQVGPVAASVLYVNQQALSDYGLEGLLSDGPHPVNAAFLNTLAERFALRTVVGKVPQGDPTHVTELVATRYAQSEKNKGDGRAGVMNWETPDGGVTSLSLKGVGQTPYCDPERAFDNHKDGYLATHAGLPESIWPRVVNNMMSLPTPDTIMILGLQHFQSGFDKRITGQEQALVLVRGGQLLRPAHLIMQGVYDQYYVLSSALKSATPDAWPTVPDTVLGQNVLLDGVTERMSPEYFIRLTHAAGVLQYRQTSNGEVPDLKATLLDILDRFALTAAQSWAYRYMQAAPSPGNIEVFGGVMDVETSSTNPRTGRTYVLPYTFPFGRSERTWRAVAVKMMADSLRLNLSPVERELYNFGDIDFPQEFALRFGKHLRTEYLKAMGFKDEVVTALQAKDPDAVDRFVRVLDDLATMENPGPIPLIMTNDEKGELIPEAPQQVKAKSVVDVFGFLGQWPRRYFDALAAGQKPSVEEALKFLDPIYEGSGDERARTTSSVTAMAADLVGAYDRLMQSALRDGVGRYDGPAEMQRDVVARAEHRNSPMTELFYWNLRQSVFDAIAQQDPTTGQTVMSQREHFWPFVHGRAERSFRNTDALLRDRGVVDRGNGETEVGVIAHGNTTYGVSANTTTGDRQLFVRIPVGTGNGYEVNLLGSGISIPAVDGATILFRLTEANQTVTGEAEARQIEIGGYQYLEARIPLQRSQYGAFAGSLRIPGTADMPLLDYAYVSPDNTTVRGLAAQRTPSQ